MWLPSQMWSHRWRRSSARRASPGRGGCGRSRGRAAWSPRPPGSSVRGARDRLGRGLRPPYADRHPTPTRLPPVVLVPGFLAGDGSLTLDGQAPAFARSPHLPLGDARQRRLHPQAATEALEQRIEAVAAKRGRRVTRRRAQPRRAAGPRGGRPPARPGARGSSRSAARSWLPVPPTRCCCSTWRWWSACRRAGLGAVMGADCTSGDCARDQLGGGAQPDPAPAWPSPRSSPGATASSTGAAAWTRRPGPSRCAPATWGWPSTRPSSTSSPRRSPRTAPGSSAASARPAGRQLRRVGGLAPRREQVIRGDRVGRLEQRRRAGPGRGRGPTRGRRRSAHAMNESPAPTVSTTSTRGEGTRTEPACV